MFLSHRSPSKYLLEILENADVIFQASVSPAMFQWVAATRTPDMHNKHLNMFPYIYSPYFPQICPMFFTSESTTSAKEHFGQSLALLASARAHFGRGTCLAALRRREEALEELSEAVAMCPTMVGAIINLAGLVGRGEGLPSQCQARINKAQTAV